MSSDESIAETIPGYRETAARQESIRATHYHEVMQDPKAHRVMEPPPPPRERTREEQAAAEVEYGRRFDAQADAWQQKMRSTETINLARLRDGARQVYVDALRPKDGATVEQHAAELRARRLAKIAPVPLPTLPAARASVKQAEGAEAGAGRAIQDAVKAEADAAADVVTIAAKLDGARTKAHELHGHVAAGREQEAELVAAGDLAKLVAHSLRMEQLTLQHEGAEKIAGQIEAHHARLMAEQEATGQRTQAARANVLHSRLEVAAARMQLAAVEIAAEVAKRLVPLVAQVDQVMVELAAAGEDPGQHLGAVERIEAQLRASVQGDADARAARL